MASKKAPEKDDFEKKAELYKLSFELDSKRNKLRMKELEYLRESDRMHHDFEMNRQRIKSAEIRKMQMRKEASAYKY